MGCFASSARDGARGGQERQPNSRQPPAAQGAWTGVVANGDGPTPRGPQPDLAASTASGKKPAGKKGKKGKKRGNQAADRSEMDGGGVEGTEMSQDASEMAQSTKTRKKKKRGEKKGAAANEAPADAAATGDLTNLPRSPAPVTENEPNPSPVDTAAATVPSGDADPDNATEPADPAQPLLPLPAVSPRAVDPTPPSATPATPPPPDARSPQQPPAPADVAPTVEAEPEKRKSSSGSGKDKKDHKKRTQRRADVPLDYEPLSGRKISKISAWVEALPREQLIDPVEFFRQRYGDHPALRQKDGATASERPKSEQVDNSNSPPHLSDSSPQQGSPRGERAAAKLDAA